MLADGFKFAHPLKHLGKSKQDLPVLAIDSFQHMFLFENMKDLPIAGKLRQVFLIKKIDLKKFLYLIYALQFCGEIWSILKV